MAEDNDLEKRAIEELLRETDRARARAETMGPAGWLKCPLRSTNKRFLINTLRSTGLQRHTGESTAECSATRGRLGSESPERTRGRSRSPRRDHRNNGGQGEHKYHHRGLRRNEGKSHDRDRKPSHRHRDSREHTNSKDQQKTEKHRH